MILAVPHHSLKFGAFPVVQPGNALVAVDFHEDAARVVPDLFLVVVILRFKRHVLLFQVCRYAAVGRGAPQGMLPGDRRPGLDHRHLHFADGRDLFLHTLAAGALESSRVPMAFLRNLHGIPSSVFR